MRGSHGREVPPHAAQRRHDHAPEVQAHPAGLARRARKEPAGDQIWTFLEALCPEEDLAKLDGLTLEGFAELAAAWQKDSRVNQGESSAS
ncbi:hypothetical protein [Microbacterium sp. NIBRBAC000506063]|uniref:hypothetical protein n=1 Tax=Microbacterium sp. NIBRBAC000506063 TaxID=2734618 RepID=UPI001BB67575|nr:hypothetical protein [Microbacterium sp. NIBRBAC000506063]QTV79487.1 hypothetical protein KAE78_11325 [Microbacterium sp. NIBRBAC000506063]